MRPSPSRARWSGFSLIELMIALLIGTLVVAAASGLFLSSKRTYATTETLSRIQENSRVAFELMAREIREAGGSACGNDLEIVNVLRNRGADWWTDLNGGLRGWENGALAGSLAGTDAIDMVSGSQGGVDARTDGNSATSANFDTRPLAHGFADGEILVVCDNQSAAVFQVSVNNPTTGRLVRNAGSGTPGNCSTRLGTPQSPACSVSSGVARAWLPPTVVTRLSPTRWFVGANARGGTSLFRQTIQVSGAGVVSVGDAEEIVEGVTDMELTYLEAGGNSYALASAAVDWEDVVSVEIELTFAGVAGAQLGREIRGTDGAVLDRAFSHRVNLRNRTL